MAGSLDCPAGLELCCPPSQLRSRPASPRVAGFLGKLPPASFCLDGSDAAPAFRDLVPAPHLPLQEKLQI